MRLFRIVEVGDFLMLYSETYWRHYAMGSKHFSVFCRFLFHKSSYDSRKKWIHM